MTNTEHAPPLPVIFRAERAGQFKGQITAVFPTLAADYAGREFTVYAHIGQHGGGALAWYRGTRAARPDEYADLLCELRGIYETPGFGEAPQPLLVRQRFSTAMRDAWQTDAREATAAAIAADMAESRWRCGPAMLAEFAPVQGHIWRKGRYTIRKPAYWILDESGRRIGAIAQWGEDSGAMQIGRDAPQRIVGSCYYHLTGYGRGTATSPESRAALARQGFGGPARDLGAALFYMLGPDHPLIVADSALRVVRIEESTDAN